MSDGSIVEEEQKQQTAESRCWKSKSMKRFFKPIEKEGSAKKPTLSPSKKDGENNCETSQEENKKEEPLKFVTWNANSLLLRVKNNWPEFSKFVTNFDPDVIAIQVSLFFIILSVDVLLFD